MRFRRQDHKSGGHGEMRFISPASLGNQRSNVEGGGRCGFMQDRSGKEAETAQTMRYDSDDSCNDGFAKVEV